MMYRRSQPIATAMKPLPYLTNGLPGTGGQLRQELEDFRVTEIPAYEASGTGDHVLCWVEKRGLTSFQAVSRLAAALGISEADIGVAGMKDKLAITVQQMSFPPPITPESVQVLELEGLTIRSAARHPNKLKTGHLRGNRFELVVREPSAAKEDVLGRAQAVLAELGRAPGMPNWFGPQRFGRDGQTAEQGRDLVLKRSRRGPRGKKRRLYISAYQSLLFNEYLVDRIEDGLYRTLLGGDLAQIRGHARVFDVEDLETETPRFDAGEIVATGPMFGHRMRLPKTDTPACEREQSLLKRHQLQLDSFAHLGKLAQGTRRALSVSLGEASAALREDGNLVVTFSLPAGSYATIVLREIIKMPEATET